MRGLNVVLLEIEKTVGHFFGCCANAPLEKKNLNVLCGKFKIE